MIPTLILNNNIDLTNSSDVKYLIEQSANCGDLAILIRDHLEDYLGFFDEPFWYQIGAMGTYPFYTQDKKIFSKDIREMLILTKKLNALKRFDGFEYLLAGFKNKPQIYSSLFETNVAFWCQSRDGFNNLVFSPPANGKIPEFCWLFRQGDILCECKRIAFNESKFQNRALNVLGVCKCFYDEIGDWPPDIRIDVVFDGTTTNNIDKKICELLSCANRAIKTGDAQTHFVSTGLEISIRKRNQSIPKKYGEIVVAQAIHEKAGQPSKLLEDVQVSVNVAVEFYETSAVKNMINRARKKIPKNEIGAIFIETSHVLPKIRSKINELISQDEYANTPLISLWIQGEPVYSTWRKGHFFEESMFVNENIIQNDPY